MERLSLKRRSIKEVLGPGLEEHVISLPKSILMVMGPMPERAQPRCHSLPLLSVEFNDCRCALLHSVSLKEGIPLRSRVRVIHCCSCSISWQICLIDGSKGAPLCAAAYRISLEMQFLSGPD